MYSLQQIYTVRCSFNLKRKDIDRTQCPIFMLFGSLWLSQFLARKKSSTYQTTAYVGEASAKSDS